MGQSVTTQFSLLVSFWTMDSVFNKKGCSWRATAKADLCLPHYVHMCALAHSHTVMHRSAHKEKRKNLYMLSLNNVDCSRRPSTAQYPAVGFIKTCPIQRKETLTTAEPGHPGTLEGQESGARIYSWGSQSRDESLKRDSDKIPESPLLHHLTTTSLKCDLQLLLPPSP